MQFFDASATAFARQSRSTKASWPVTKPAAPIIVPGARDRTKPIAMAFLKRLETIM